MNKYTFTSINLKKNSVLTTSEFLSRNKKIIQDEIDKQINKINFIMNNKAGYEFEKVFSKYFEIRKARGMGGEIDFKRGFKKLKKKLEYKNFPDFFINEVEKLQDQKGLVSATIKPDFNILIADDTDFKINRKRFILETKNSSKSIKKKQKILYLLAKVIYSNTIGGVVYIINNSKKVYKDELGVIYIGFDYIKNNGIKTIEELSELILKTDGSYKGNESVHYYKETRNLN